MDRVFVVQLAFALAVVLVGASLVLIVNGLLSRQALLGIVAILGVAAAAAWVVFAFSPTAEGAVAAAGLTVSAAIEASLLLLRPALARVRRVDRELSGAEARLREVIDRETRQRTAELDRALARARAESVSLLLEEERRIAEERRKAVVEIERDAGSELASTLAATQERVERRIAEWTQDLDRAQQAFAAQAAKLAERQRRLIAEAETRILAGNDRLEADAEGQRALLLQVREQIQHAAQDAASAGTAELESAALERRRALNELGEQLRRREQAIGEQIDREETEAVRRIQAGFAEVERRQVEQLERVVARASQSYSEAAGQQFADAIKSAREEAARRLSRELDRAVQAFAREASTVLAERLAQVGDAGAQRLEKRLNGITAGLERQREEFVAAFERRLVEAEEDLRRRLELVAKDVEAERTVLRARLEDVSRQIDEFLIETRERLAELEGLRTR